MDILIYLYYYIILEQKKVFKKYFFIIYVIILYSLSLSNLIYLNIKIIYTIYIMDISILIDNLSKSHEKYYFCSIKKRIELAKKILDNLNKCQWEYTNNWIDESLKLERISKEDDIYQIQGETVKFVMGILIKRWLTNFIRINSNINYWEKCHHLNNYLVYGPYNIGYDCPGITYELLCNTNMVHIPEYNEKSEYGTVSLVLGAGNQNFLSLIDVLHRVFMYNECVLLKHHPLRPFLYEPYNMILKPLIDENIVSMILDSGNDHTQNIIENPAKLLIYVGLTAYWVVIIFGTFFQI